jgi:hypothetical protein
VSADLVRSVVVAGLGTLVASCALATFGGDEYSTTCDFEGRASAPCGACIAAHCQAKVDACCADSECKKGPESGSAFGISVTPPLGEPGVLARLDACAKGGSCQDLETDSHAQAIATCVEASCQDACDLWRASTLHADGTSCETDADTEPATCTCTVPADTADAPSSANSASCTTASLGGAVCCADKDWPSPASQCTCRPATCRSYSNGCICGFDYTSSEDHVADCSRGSCCLRTDGTCACSDDPCSDVETPVDSCTPELVTCGTSQRTVDRCSAE